MHKSKSQILSAASMLVTPSNHSNLHLYPYSKITSRHTGFQIKFVKNFKFLSKIFFLFASFIFFLMFMTSFQSIVRRIAINNIEFDLLQINQSKQALVRYIDDYRKEIRLLNGTVNKNNYSIFYLEDEIRHFKHAINQAYLSVNRTYLSCDYSPDHTLKGEIKVDKMLGKLNLSNLIEFYSNDSYDTANNRNKPNFELFYLKFDKKPNSTENLTDFNMDYFNLWHSNDINLLNTSIPSESNDLIEYNRIEIGGHWKPLDCISRFKVAIIIPFRDRLPHLKVISSFLHMFLQRQMLDYRIFVVEPTIPLNVSFNKGRVMNAAYLEVLKADPKIDCIIFHDVDLVPEDDRNMYTCADRPKHLSVAIDKFEYRLPYDYLVGGVLSIRPDQYKQINGYSNSYWGWGGEDDDFAQRIKQSNLIIQRPPARIAKYRMIKHLPQKLNNDRHKLLQRVSLARKNDGLNSVNYKIVNYKLFKLFTYILIDVGLP